MGVKKYYAAACCAVKIAEIEEEKYPVLKLGSIFEMFWFRKSFGAYTKYFPVVAEYESEEVFEVWCMKLLQEQFPSQEGWQHMVKVMDITKTAINWAKSMEENDLLK